MSENIIIRQETEKDYRTVEELTRKAFWNLYIPGCAEHYVAHVIRGHEDFIPELDLVMELEGRIIGSIMYTKTKLIDESGEQKHILTFGPVCIDPEFQRKGYGRKLIMESFKRAVQMGYEAVVIFGDPDNYVGCGFKSCKKYNVSVDNGTFPAAMLVKELKENALDKRAWNYVQSPAFDIDEQEAEQFDKNFPEMEKKHLPCQEAFYIISQAVIR